MNDNSLKLKPRTSKEKNIKKTKTIQIFDKQESLVSPFDNISKNSNPSKVEPTIINFSRQQKQVESKAESKPKTYEPKLVEQTIAIDLRCFNYSVFTGVNIYAIKFLESLLEYKKSQSSVKNIKFVGIGLKQNVENSLRIKILFWDELFDENITLGDYLGNNFVKNKLVGIIELIQIQKSRAQKSLFDANLHQFDYIIQLQPRILRIHPNSKLVTIFHDVFAIINNSQSFKQSLVYNTEILNIITQDCHKIISNSIATSKDIVRLLGTDNQIKNKINLIYPYLPIDQNLEVEDDILDNITPKNSYYYLYIGAIEPRKNLERLILAHNYYTIEVLNQTIHNKLEKNLVVYNQNTSNSFRIGNQEPPKPKPLNLVIAGRIVDQQYFDFLKKVIIKNKITNVTWRIDVDENLKNNLIQDSKFCVYPSLYEGFGFPIVEARSYNKICLTSQNSSCLEVGELCGNAMFVNPLKINEIAAGILLLDQDLAFFEKEFSINSSYFNPFGGNEITNFWNKTLI